MNNVVLVGRLTKDPELRYTPTGTPVGTFILAVDREYKNKESEKETDFIPVQVWGKSAENCVNYIIKGSLVGVQGSIRIESYKNKDGENRRATRINANRVQFLDNRKQNIDSKFETAELEAEGFQAIDEDDIPF